MDHYFNSIEMHLSDGQPGSGGGAGGNSANNNNNNMMMGGHQHMQQGGGGQQAGQSNTSGFPGPLSGLHPGSRQSSSTMPSGGSGGFPGPLQGLQPGSRHSSIGMEQAIQQHQQQQQQQQNQPQQHRSSTTSINNPYTSEELLNILDDDIHETSHYAQQNMGGQQGNNDATSQQQHSRHQQQQMIMAALQSQQNRRTSDIVQSRRTSDIQNRRSSDVSQQGQGGNMMAMQQQQQQQGQGQMMQQSNQMQQISNQMQQSQQMTQQSVSRKMQQQEQQIQNFLQLHSNQLNPEQRMNLQQELVRLQTQNRRNSLDAIRGSGGGGSNNSINQMSGNTSIGQQQPQHTQGGRGGMDGVGGGMDGSNAATNMNAAMVNQMTAANGGQDLSVDDLMSVQREQLRQLQSMVKSHAHDPATQRQLNAMLQQQVAAQAQMQQAQQSQGGGGGGQMHGGHSHGQQQRQSSSSMVMQQMLQQHPIQQMQRQAEAQQQQQQQMANNNIMGMAQGGGGGRRDSAEWMQAQAAQKRQSLMAAQQEQQSQQSLMANRHGLNSSISPVPIGSKSPLPGLPGPPTAQVQRKTSLTSSNPQAEASATSNAAAATAMASSSSRGGAGVANASRGEDAASSATTTRVVPVSISPFARSAPTTASSTAIGGVADSALIYTKYALRSIVASLNERARKNSDANDSRREYTARDLSTCLGAWDLNVASGHNSSGGGSNKRQRLEDGSSGAAVNGGTSGNADTAFQFYYERSCPILLDAKEKSRDGGPSSTPLPFSVEDFGDAAAGSSSHWEGGEDDANALPVVAGAVVLTYGADSKFTGGIGEEGVLTKAIVEFFYDEAVAVAPSSASKAAKETSDEKKKRKELEEDALVEAEEQIFTRVDPGEEQSGSLIQAALFALSPNLVADQSSSSPSDDGIYIPTIWSGNTDRIYQYCLLGNFDDNGNERSSKRLCVAIQKKKKEKRHSKNKDGDNDRGPSKGVCRVTLTLSPQSVIAKKKKMAEELATSENENQGSFYNESQSCCTSEVHRTIRRNLRTLRPPNLTTVSGSNEDDIIQPSGKRRRQALRRRSVTQLIDHTQIVVGVRCRHELLLDADEVGKVYVNGALVVDCSSPLSSSSAASSGSEMNGGGRLLGGVDALPAHTLFGVDFTLLPSSGSFDKPSSSALTILPSKEILQGEYGALLVDALIDAGQCDADVAGKLLRRLITGSTEEVIKDVRSFDLDDDDDRGKESKSSDDRYHDQLPRAESNYAIKFDDTSRPCLESIVLSSTSADPVGIGAKAIGTKFRSHYGSEAFPVELGTSDEYRLHRILGSHKVGVPVPRRARDVLLRGAYLSIDKMAKFLWASSSSRRLSWDGDHDDAMRAAEAMEGAIKLLRMAGCRDVAPNKIRFVSRKRLDPVAESNAGCGEYDSTELPKKPPASNLRCWYDSDDGTYYVSDAILFVEEGDEQDGGAGSSGSVSTASESKAGTAAQKDDPPQVAPVSNGDIAGKEEGDVSTAEERTPKDESDEADGGSGAGDGSKAENGSTAQKDDPPQDNSKSGSTAQKDDPPQDASMSNGVSITGKEDGNMSTAEECTPNDVSEADGGSKAEDNADVEADGESKAEDNADVDNGSKKKVAFDESNTKNGQETPTTNPKPASAENAAYILAFYISKEHPDAMMLERFVTCHRNCV